MDMIRDIGYYCRYNFFRDAVFLHIGLPKQRHLNIVMWITYAVEKKRMYKFHLKYIPKEIKETS